MRVPARFIAITSASILSLLSACATTTDDPQAQSASMAARGAKPLDAQELKATLAGALISGRAFTGNLDFDWTLNPDGSLTGTNSRSAGSMGSGVFQQSGKWSVNESNQFCYETRSLESHNAGALSSSLKGCEQWFQLGNGHVAVVGGLTQARKVARR